MWPELDGIVNPEEYDCLVNSPTQPAQAYPKEHGIYVDFYYGFDGESFNFGVQKLQPCVTKAVQIRLDPDCNGAEVGDLVLTVRPGDELFAYGIYEGLTTATAVCGMPPDAQRAGVQVKCSADGDTEVWMELDTQFQNGLNPCPLEREMSIHMAIQIDVNGTVITNFVNGIVKSEGGPQITFD